MTNSLNRLAGALPTQQRYIANVMSVNANGTTTVQHSDGSKEVVLGTSVSSGSAYISDGVIVGKAADLSYIEIEV